MALSGRACTRSGSIASGISRLDAADCGRLVVADCGRSGTLPTGLEGWYSTRSPSAIPNPRMRASVVAEMGRDELMSALRVANEASTVSPAARRVSYLASKGPAFLHLVQVFLVA